MVAKDEDLDKDEAAANDAEAESAEAADTEPVEAPEKATDEAPANAPKEDVREEGEQEAVATPIQLGYRRYVYAAYMAAAIAIAFLCTKFIDYGWFKLSQYKPAWFVTIGSEPQDEITVPLSAAIGIGVAVYYWRHKKTRTLIEEIAEELTRVTWPSRQEVTNSTTTVIIATTFATLFFALMDQFWLWVTKHVYGS